MPAWFIASESEGCRESADTSRLQGKMGLERNIVGMSYGSEKEEYSNT